ncbi:beta-glucosidase family protein [Janthinobacterium sp. LB3P112]|uniref:beta-glucosidase family protein n=1 Tax=Janthinobacterium sp. LB3P112 TaxID=3424196 RepID=UPI003F2824D2
MQSSVFFSSAVFFIGTFLMGCGNNRAEVPRVAENGPDARASALVQKMTLDEKIQLVHGIGPGASPLNGAGYIPGIKRLGIPDINMADSSTSVRVANVNATVMPSTLALAASWDRDMAFEYGALIGRELRTLGFVEGLGGGINLIREPRNGRTFEYLGEDPVLAGYLLAQRTRGTQQQKVIATVKHFALNNQETNRFTSNSVVDERTMRQLYLLGFEIAIKEGQPGNVMCAYNYVNGIKACENSYLLNSVLKNEWGFKGYVQSDWSFAISNAVRAANAGLDEEQPGSLDDAVGAGGEPTYFNQKLKSALATGQVSMGRLDDMVTRKLRALFQGGIMDSPPVSGGVINRADGRAVAKKIADASIVLLKNQSENGAGKKLLPLDGKAVKSIVVIGAHASVGVMAGGGSGGPFASVSNPVACLLPEKMFSECAPYSASSPLEAIKAKAGLAQVRYFDGNDVRAASDAAATADVAIIFASQFSGEGRDLISLALPDQHTDPANQSYDQRVLIEAVAKKNPRTVVVLENGTAVTMPWLNSVSAVLAAWYPGDSGGESIADILFGDVNPSGKLPISFPKTEQDLPQRKISSSDLNVIYNEGLMMGYRWYDYHKIEPLFEFGYGLSYTSFDYTDMKTELSQNGEVKISFSLKNTGSRSGAEVMQIYASIPSDGEPPQRLIGWAKVHLTSGQQRTVELLIARERLQVWDALKRQWFIPKGSYEFRVANSSRARNILRNTKSL